MNKNTRNPKDLSYHILDLLHMISNMWLVGWKKALEISHVIKKLLAKPPTQCYWVFTNLIRSTNNLQINSLGVTAYI